MEPDLSYEVFAKNANTTFVVHLDDNNRFELELTKVSERKVFDDKQEEFSLTFRGSNKLFLGQGTRDVEHKQIGRFMLFIVPVQNDAENYFYEAVFNRFL